jgi:hypothetical protein
VDLACGIKGPGRDEGAQLGAYLCSSRLYLHFPSTAALPHRICRWKCRDLLEAERLGVMASQCGVGVLIVCSGCVVTSPSLASRICKLGNISRGNPSSYWMAFRLSNRRCELVSPTTAAARSEVLACFPSPQREGQEPFPTFPRMTEEPEHTGGACHEPASTLRPGEQTCQPN